MPLIVRIYHRVQSTEENNGRDDYDNYVTARRLVIDEMHESRRFLRVQLNEYESVWIVAYAFTLCFTFQLSM